MTYRISNYTNAPPRFDMKTNRAKNILNFIVCLLPFVNVGGLNFSMY